MVEPSSRAASGFIGLDTGANGNSATLSGSGTSWLLSSNLYVGSGGASNWLVAGKGAAVLTAGHGLIGANSGANANSAMVTDPGTSWLLSSNLYVGSNGALNRLVISNGALVGNSLGFIGNRISGSNNVAVVTGSGSAWTNASDLYVGFTGRGNQLVVSNGGVVWNSVGYVGYDTSSSNNVALVTGAGSVWSNAFPIMVGISGAGNQMVVSNGGTVWNNSGYLGLTAGSSNNVVLVTGSGSAWNTTFNLSVGQSGAGSQLVVSNGGVAFAGNGLYLGADTSSTNNRIVVDGGTLRTTNFLGMSAFDVRRGTNVLNAGLVEVDTLLLTNALSRFEFNGGTLSSRNTRVSNGTLFRAGDGAKPATFILDGNGIHDFTGTLAFTVSSNATLTGNGTIGGPLVLATGGKLIPGTAQNAIGRIIVSNSPVLLGTSILEISKNGAALTNDQIQVNASLSYGGSLVVSNLGPTALASGDTFRLFVASSYAGAFTNVSLPVLNSGWAWTNRLLVDGSIAVVGPPTPQIGSIVVSGTNVIISGTGGPSSSNYWVLASTNVALPLTNWTRILTNQFNGTGAFIFTNAIDAALPRRFYLLQVP